MTACLANKLKQEALEHLLILARDQAGGQDRLLTLAAQSFPARHTSSNLVLVHGPETTNHFQHRPMGVFTLLSPYELSNKLSSHQLQLSGICLFLLYLVAHYFASFLSHSYAVKISSLLSWFTFHSCAMEISLHSFLSVSCPLSASISKT